MIGFKAVNHDLTGYNNFKYTIDETYDLSTKPTLCKTGFHFCQIPLFVFNFYNNPDDRYLLVEATGTIVSDEIKCCTNQLKIVKEIDRETFLSESFHLDFLQYHCDLITNKNKNILLNLVVDNGHGHLEIVKYLIETHNAQVYSKLVLERAVQNGHLEVVKYLIEKCKYLIEKCLCNPYVKNELLIDSAENGHLELVKYFIETHKCDPHVYSEEALRLAAKNGHIEIVKYLIETNKCDPHVLNEEALFLATYYEHWEIVKYLIETHNCELRGDYKDF